jgi:cytochrome c-type biogenesis protein CcmF
VHSFTDLGMSGQLLVFLLMFVVLATVMMVLRWKEIPKSEKDEEIYTREFWMFIGSLVLVISAFQIVLTTSIPVFNKVFGSNLAPPSNVIEHYNKWQMPMAIIIALLTAVAHMIKYKKNTPGTLRKLGLWAVVSLAVAVGLMFAFELNNWMYLGLLFASVFAVIGNATLLKPMFAGKIQFVGSSVAHMGFGILLIGVLVSSANKKVISINQSGMQLNPEFDAQANMEHVYLEKGKALRMGDYEIEYRKDTTEWVNNYYQVHYKKIDPQTNEVEYEFDLYPNAQINPKMGLVANPDTKHYLSHDVFTYVSSVPKEKSEATFINAHSFDVAVGDTIFNDNCYIILKAINSNVKDGNIDAANMQLLIAAEMEIHTLDKVYTATPMYGIQNNSVAQFESIVDGAKLRLKFTAVNPTNGKVTIEVAEKDTSGEFIIMKAIMFPWINLVWGGTIIMIIGFTLAIIKRLQDLKRK